MHFVNKRGSISLNQGGLVAVHKKKKWIILLTIGVLMILTVSFIGIYVKCIHTDHTKEACPVTKILNIVYYINQESKLMSKHQIKNMTIAYVEDKVQIDKIEYGEIIEPVYNVYTTEVLVNCDEAGHLYYEAPEGFTLKEDGTCEKKVKIGEQFRGLYGITTYFKDGTSKELITLDFSK